LSNVATTEGITFRQLPEQTSIWSALKISDLGNQVLYELCAKHPCHRLPDAIVAKVWLISRSYSAAIERRRDAREIVDSFYEKTVVQAMQGQPIDSWLDSVGAGDESGGPRTIEIHKKLTDLFRSITKLEKRSLASKYLHFHKPEAFFIYDGRATRSIAKIVPKLSRIPRIEAKEFDPEYRDFVCRCVWLRESVEKTLGGVRLTPRELDKILLNRRPQPGL